MKMMMMLLMLCLILAPLPAQTEQELAVELILLEQDLVLLEAGLVELEKDLEQERNNQDTHIENIKILYEDRIKKLKEKIVSKEKEIKKLESKNFIKNILIVVVSGLFTWEKIKE